MRWLIIVVAISSLARARPEKYKEQEDFQYSRSSSDEGSKSGYYGAQRGNMGGNYERAHNMDALAQNQMSGLVRQVDGDLGDGSKTRAGSVYSAASSRGTYGSGSFDSSNLQGRNFAEGVSYDNSNLRSSLTQSSTAQHNSVGYTNSHSQSYGGYRRTASDTQTDLQSLDNLQASNQQTYGNTRHTSGYQSHAGFQEQRHYDSDRDSSHSGYGSNIYTSLTPVRIVVTPGGRVALPVATQVYDGTHQSSVFNHNALDSEVATASDNNQDSVYRPKYYESSYRYNKKWEKHDTIPTSGSGVRPTESSIPKNSELYEDVDIHTSGNQNSARETDYQRGHSGSASERYHSAAAKSITSQSGYNTNYNSEQYGGSSSNSQTGYKTQLDHGFSSDSLNAYTQAQRNSASSYSGTDSGANTESRYNTGSQLDLNGQVEDLSTKPKSYHSSYSYHKSWERQGDPYVIKPASSIHPDSHTSQRLTSSTKNVGYATYQPSSQYSQRTCEENCHIRVARSYGTDNQDMEQQSQNLDNNKDLNQQVQGTWQNLEDLGQISQKGWDQQTDGQQSLNQWDNLKDLGQQSQSNWDQQNFGQQSQSQSDNLSDLGQQSQNIWDNLGQHSQSSWDQQNVEQEKSQNPGNNLENLSQQSQSNWDQLNVGQGTNNRENAFEDLGQISQNNWDQQNVGQQSNMNWDKIETLGQQSNSNWDQQNVGQQSSNNWDKLEKLDRHSDVGQQSLNQNTWDKLEDIRQDNQKTDNSEFFGQHAQNFLEQHNQDNAHELTYKSQNDLYAQYEHKTNLEQSETVNKMEHEKKIDILWNKLDNIDTTKEKKDFSNNKNTTDTTIKIPINVDMDQTPMKSYFDDDSLSQKESQSFKDNINDNIDIAPHQKESNENSDYSYSRGFVNPFFNQYHKNQLSHYDSTYTENNGAFESNNWDSHIHYSNSHHNTNTNIQNTPLTNLWSKFDKIETESGLSTNINLSTPRIISTFNQTRSNSSLVANQNSTPTTTISPPWYVQEPHQSETSSVSNIPEYTGLSYDKNAHKDRHTLRGEAPETPRDIGRGDIGPEEVIDVNKSNKLYRNPTSSVSQNTSDNPVNQDNNKPSILQNNNQYKKKELLDDQLTVLSIQQQKHESKFVLSNKNDTTNNILRTNSQNNNSKHNKISNIGILNQSETLTQTENFDFVQTIAKTEPNPSYQNYSPIHQEQEVSNGNLEQQSVNIEQDNLYNFGQEDLQVYTQQNEKSENHYLQNFQETLQDFRDHNENLEQQNLYNFGQEQTLDGGHKNVEQHTSRPENKLDIRTHNLQNSYMHNENTDDDNEKQIKDFGQGNLKSKNNDTDMNIQLVSHENEILTQASPRVQKSVGSMQGDGNPIAQNDLLHVQQKIQDLRAQSELIPQHQLEHNYGIDYEPSINSFEQDFEHDIGQQHASNGHLNNMEQKGINIVNIPHNTQENKMEIKLTTSTTNTQKENISSQSSQKPEKVTEKPGFWRSVGNKFSSAKDKVVSWFKS